MSGYFEVVHTIRFFDSIFTNKCTVCDKILSQICYFNNFYVCMLSNILHLLVNKDTLYKGILCIPHLVLRQFL